MKQVIDFSGILESYGITITGELTEEQKEKIAFVLTSQIEMDQILKELKLIVEK